MSRLALAMLVALVACGGAKVQEREGMKHIPAGEFMMGSRADDPKVYEWEAPHEQPQHAVYTKGYFIDIHEVTNAEYEHQVPSHKRDTDYSPCDDCPVTQVTWDDAQNYCHALGKRLPTEAEWEKAAKGGTDTDPTPLEDYAWFAKNSISRTQPVMQKKPNGYGLYDVLGNVREWTGDWYRADYYQQRVRDNPTGPPAGAPEGPRRAERGGAFFLPARSVTTTIRYNHPQAFHLYFLGFRCAADE
jgi:formylglycine-generating enzyme required for sulfatase activity